MCRTWPAARRKRGGPSPGRISTARSCWATTSPPSPSPPRHDDRSEAAARTRWGLVGLISVLINAPEDPQALTRLLTALVPAAAEGLVREVGVIGAAGPAHAIADDAGAGLYDDFAGA